MALLVIGSARAKDFVTEARAQEPGRDIRLWPDTAGNRDDIRYALAWGPPSGALKTCPNLRFIVSVGAGVDHLFRDPELPDIPIVRFVDPDLTSRMAAYVALQVLYHHRRMGEFALQQQAKVWRYLPEPQASEVRVGIMGLGVMGLGALPALRTLGYQLRGWSQTAKHIDGVTCFAGVDQLEEFARETDVMVCVLPLTPETRGILNGDLIGKLSRQGRHPRMPGPVIVNAGRGGLQVESDIVAALQSSRLYGASLDVFETEPLPPSSPLWRHPRVVITPHNAAESATEAIVAYFLRQVGADEQGRALENVVDRQRGY